MTSIVSSFTYSTPEEAHEAYKNKKKELINESIKEIIQSQALHDGRTPV